MKANLIKTFLMATAICTPLFLSAQDKTDYKVSLNSYKSGVTDTASLGTLLDTLASRKDYETGQNVARRYLSQLKAPYQRTQIARIVPFLRDVNHPLYKQFVKDRIKIGHAFSENLTNWHIREAIVYSIINPALAQGDVNWTEVEKKVRAYGADGKEALAYHKMNYFKSRKQWLDYANSYDEYFQIKKGDIWSFDLNNKAWMLFQCSDDPRVLSLALGWIKHVLEQSPLSDSARPAFMDTQANLLFKLGRKQEGIQVQQEAIALAKKLGVNATEFEQTLLKMQKGVK